MYKFSHRKHIQKWLLEEEQQKGRLTLWQQFVGTETLSTSVDSDDYERSWS